MNLAMTLVLNGLAATTDTRHAARFSGSPWTTTAVHLMGNVDESAWSATVDDGWAMQR